MSISENCAILDTLQNHSFEQMATALRERTDRIITRWEQLVQEFLPAADSLTLAQVRDEVPQTLAKLADALESRAPETTQRLIVHATGHGTERLHEGYNIEELIVEYRLFRRVVIEEVESALGRRTTTNEDVALSMGIDAVVQEGVVVFVTHQRNELLAALESESKLMTFLSHDLRNKLNHVTLIIELLTRKLRDKPEFAEDIADARSAQQSILETIEGMEQLLESARLKKDDVKIKCEPVNLLQKLTSIAAEFMKAADEKGIKVVTRVPEGAVVTTDRRMLALILQNLISNALKYSARGTITIAAAQTNGQWSLAVADEGPGIAPERVETLFAEFVRGETHGQPGLGLGLAIARKAAKRLGATLTVESSPGVGSTFRLLLPRN